MKISIRNATQKDNVEISKLFAELDALHTEALPQIFRKVEGPARSEEYLGKLINNENTVVFVAIIGGKIVGLVNAFIRESPSIPELFREKYAVVDSLIVAKRYRRLGIGQDLMEKVQRWAVQKKLPQIEFNVWDFNTEAIKFYKRLGYSMARHQMWKSTSDSIDKRNET